MKNYKNIPQKEIFGLERLLSVQYILEEGYINILNKIQINFLGARLDKV
jgi:hypothetical protein